MKIAHIMPLSLTHLATNNPIALCLAQFILADEHYAQMYRAYAAGGGNWLIMDNGLAEDGKPLPPEQLLEAADIVRPQEIVLPDYLDPDRNVKAAAATLQHEAFMTFVETYRAKLMYVPHGDNLWDWVQNLATVTRFDRMPDSIGISKFHDRIHPHSPVYGRGPLGLLARGLFPELPLHYLGLGMTPMELTYMPFARSCDTGVAAMYGKAGIRLSKLTGALFRPDISYEHEAAFTLAEEMDVIHNMNAMNDIASNGGMHLWLNG